MNRVILILLTIVLFLPCFGQEIRQIKSRKIKVVSCRVENRQKNEAEIKFTRTEFDRKGREILVNEYNADSLCVTSETFEYNRKGKLTTHIKIDSVAHQTTIIRQNYDRWNRLIEKQTWTNARRKERITYTYNNLDNRLSEITYDEKDSIKKQTTYTYDKRGMLLIKRTIDDSGKLLYEKTNTYDY